tara:strand:- start:1081 stop:2658 length:1578 start_codon:yes stop_codon:yes gene_type:complete
MSLSIRERFFKNTAVVSVFTMLSRVFGYIRDALMFIFISNTSGALDAFFVAFRIPNFFRRIFGEGALSTAYIPVLSDYKSKEEKDEVKEFINTSITTISLILLVISIIGVLIAPILIYLIAPGFVNSETGQYDLSVSLLKITFPYMLFICLTAIAGSILNTYDNFAYPAITPVVLNLTLIISVLFFVPYFDEPVFALAWGLLFGGLIQLAFQIYPIAKLGLFPKIKFNSKHPGIIKIKEIMLPMIFGSSVTQINMIFDTVIASFLITGSIGWLYMSDRFVELPLALFGISIATVLLPKLSEYYNKSDNDSYNKTLNWGFKLAILISFPTMLGLILLSDPILITLLNYKEFSFNDVHMTSIALIAFSLGLPGMIGSKILITNYYSRKDTRYPVNAALKAVICNFILNITFVLYLVNTNFNGAHIGLALATSISAYVNFFFLLKTALKTKIFVMDKHTFIILIKSLIATLIMSIFILFFDLTKQTWMNYSFTDRAVNLSLLIISATIIYFTMLYLFNTKPKNLKQQS